MGLWRDVMAELRRRLSGDSDSAAVERRVGRLHDESRHAVVAVQREAVKARRSLRDAQRSILEAGEEVGEAMDQRRRG